MMKISENNISREGESVGQVKDYTYGFREKKVKNVKNYGELPCDVLDNISKTLDFDDLFQFSGVCKNWRDFHKRIFLTSQEPLLLQNFVSGSFLLHSIPNQNVCCLKKMIHISRSKYIASSCGNFIKVRFFNNSFLLINPFTRIKKEIKFATFKVNPSMDANHALLALSKCSDEFVLVVLCKLSRSLHVYQSRNCGWVTNSSKMGNREWVVHFMVLHNVIYAITNKANIGVLSLNFGNIKFLKLKITPKVNSKLLMLVNCDEQLLMVHVSSSHEIRNVYKIDFSTMNYVKLETLGDVALFYSSNFENRNCYALSNPNRWGYERNSVYVTNQSSTICKVYSGDDKKLLKCITLPTPSEPGPFSSDWYFRHLQYEIDDSLC